MASGWPQSWLAAGDHVTCGFVRETASVDEVQRLHRHRPQPELRHRYLGDRLRGLRRDGCAGHERRRGPPVQPHGGNGGFLDVNATAALSSSPAPSTMSPPPEVRTARATAAAGSSSRPPPRPGDGLVRYNDTVQLWNTYANRGGFLETNGTSSASSARYDVDTNAYSNRSNLHVTFRKFLPAT